MPLPANLSEAYRHCTQLVATHDRDRYVASLFVPEDERVAIHALQAFSIELARVRDAISEPMPGEIRLQWWRDVISATAQGEAERHPVAAALMDVIVRYALPQDTFLNMIDARTFDLYDDPMPSLNDLEGYCGETASALLQLAAIIASDGDDPGTTDLSGHAGVAYGITGLMRAVGFHAQRNQVYLPQDLMAKSGVSVNALRQGKIESGLDPLLASLRLTVDGHLNHVRHLWPEAPQKIRPVYLAIALIPVWLTELEKAGPQVLLRSVDLPPWRRPWVLWRASRRQTLL